MNSNLQIFVDHKKLFPNVVSPPPLPITIQAFVLYLRVKRQIFSATQNPTLLRFCKIKYLYQLHVVIV